MCFLCEDILKIDNLWSLVNLTKLQMDNNIIERIEGLDMLVNLEWLGMKSHISKIAFQQLHVLDGQLQLQEGLDWQMVLNT